MRYRALWALSLVIVALLSFASWGGRAQGGPQRKTWEYKVVVEQFGAQPATMGEQHMNKLGAEGWELVDTRVVPFLHGGDTQYRTDYHFKRAR